MIKIDAGSMVLGGVANKTEADTSVLAFERQRIKVWADQACVCGRHQAGSVTGSFSANSIHN